MGKTIRPTYPKEFSIGLLFLIFIISSFLSYQIFDVHHPDQDSEIYFGMFLVGIAADIMVLIMWEEILFPLMVKEVKGGLIFRNHRTKLKVQMLIYCTIPAIFAFIYFEYNVHLIKFIIGAILCMVPPLVEKLASGINNYNDFLMLTNRKIEYKNNEKHGSFETKDIVEIMIIKDESKFIEKLQLLFTNNDVVIIDLDEMELDDFYDSINEFIINNYQHLMKITSPV